MKKTKRDRFHSLCNCEEALLDFSLEKVFRKSRKSFGALFPENRKAQLKMQQMVIMLLAVTLFFVLAGLLIVATQFSGLNQRAALIQSDNAKLLASNIANSPEFSCGSSFGTDTGSCVDFDKVASLENLMKQYGNGSFWGIQGLQIRIIYPKSSTGECTISNFPNCDRVTLIPNSNGTGVSNFVSLCGYSTLSGQSYTKCTLAEIIVTYQGA